MLPSCYHPSISPLQFASRVIFFNSLWFPHHTRFCSLTLLLNADWLKLFEWRSWFGKYDCVCACARVSYYNYYHYYFGKKVEDVVMCHSALEVRRSASESAKLHDRFKTKGFILTETDKPSTAKFPCRDSPVLLYISDLISYQESLYNNCVKFFCCHFVFSVCFTCQFFVVCFMHCDQRQVPLWQQRDFFWSNDILSVAYSI